VKRVINRITYWNSLRYKQEYDNRLTYKLLDEEVEELHQAKTDVDKLDALVDILYVAVGGMWKLGLSPEQIEAAINVVCDSNDSKTAKATASHIKANIDKGEGFIRPEPRLQEILDE
jgi:predicted HAD superfamily Cof-like phosphohydrolase